MIKANVNAYIALHPVLRTLQSVLYFTPLQTYSYQHQFHLPTKISAMLQLLREQCLQPGNNVMRLSELRSTKTKRTVNICVLNNHLTKISSLNSPK